MNSASNLTRAIALAMVHVMMAVSLMVVPAEAGMITTEQLLAQENARDDRSRIADFVTRADVRQQMQALGVDPDEAEARIAALSDDELRQIRGQLDRLPAGQGVLETAIVASLFVFIILLVTDILGYT
ncbi:MAG: PA2779 family protein, partial [Geminicoccaceae bacterium]